MLLTFLRTILDDSRLRQDSTADYKSSKRPVQWEHKVAECQWVLYTLSFSNNITLYMRCVLVGCANSVHWISKGCVHSSHPPPLTVTHNKALYLTQLTVGFVLQSEQKANRGWAGGQGQQPGSSPAAHGAAPSQCGWDTAHDYHWDISINISER